MTISNTIAAAFGAVAFGTSTLLAGTAIAAPTPPNYGSEAAITGIAIDVAGTQVGGMPIGDSSGAGAPAYRDVHVVLNDNRTIQIPGSNGQLALVVNVPVGHTRADGHRLTDKAGYLAVGLAAVKTVKVALITPGIVPVDLLLIKASHLRTEADAQTTLSGKQTNMTSASASAVTISGTLLGGQVIHLAGTLKPGIVFSSPVLTIKTATFTKSVSPTGENEVTVRGLDVVLRKAQILGSVLSGHIILGTSSAY